LKITVKYFSWIRVKLNKYEDLFDVDDKFNFKDFKSYLIKRDNFYLEVFNDDSIKFFINFKEIANEDIKLFDGDELGILPPVTGG
jgi:molybdopterin converting factor small subunit|tara:strand:+ start:13491 stop:13745 length:255 start_codon:yes stop_codon:yes gene_type:complete